MRNTGFIKLFAQAYRVEEPTVAVFIRALKEAGELSKGARGINAPHFTTADAAALTVALLATDRPAQAVDRLRRFRGLCYIAADSDEAAAAALRIAPGATLVEFLAGVFGGLEILGGSANPYVEVQENARTALVEFSWGGQRRTAVFRDPPGGRSEAVATADRIELQGMRRSRGLASSELTHIAAAFEAERATGKSFEQLAGLAR